MTREFAEIPDELWERIKHLFPERRRSPRGGRPPVDDRKALAGIVYRLRTGCQWDAIPSDFGSPATCYRRFVEWTEDRVFEKIHLELVIYYHDRHGIDLEWTSLDSASVKAPKGGITPGRIPQIAQS